MPHLFVMFSKKESMREMTIWHLQIINSFFADKRPDEKFHT